VLLEERLRSALSKDARSGDSTGVLFLDLDGFKSVNDRHGHAVGDTLLRTVADRLVAAVRPSTRWPGSAGTSSWSWSRRPARRRSAVLVQRLRAEVSRPISGRAPGPQRRV
jgi:GGDEF domain-containing protein